MLCFFCLFGLASRIVTVGRMPLQRASNAICCRLLKVLPFRRDTVRHPGHFHNFYITASRVNTRNSGRIKVVSFRQGTYVRTTFFLLPRVAKAYLRRVATVVAARASRSRAKTRNRAFLSTELFFSKKNFVSGFPLGAFHSVKPSDMMAELQGRLPVRVELKPLTEEDFRQILCTTRNNLVEQNTGRRFAAVAQRDLGSSWFGFFCRHITKFKSKVGRLKIDCVTFLAF